MHQVKIDPFMKVAVITSKMQFAGGVEEHHVVVCIKQAIYVVAACPQLSS